ncbi:hypothetical protein V6N11_082080 [Hibiscus sabdariffa]|uniref:Uncharacterized protein n=1 Tax=Hibiscus sabdariffa TaxID=183260 RepID=A0ABR2QGX0_9ROSI
MTKDIGKAQVQTNDMAQITASLNDILARLTQTEAKVRAMREDRQVPPEEHHPAHPVENVEPRLNIGGNNQKEAENVSEEDVDLTEYDIEDPDPRCLVIRQALNIQVAGLSPIVSLADLDPCYFEVISSIQSLPRFGTALAARTETVLYP